MSYIQSKGREANKKKKYIFFLLPVALFDQRLPRALLFRTSFSAPAGSLSYGGFFFMLCTCVGFNCFFAWFVFARIICSPDDA